MTGYDDGNIFARIIRGEIPCHKVYEDDGTLVFMDIMPQAEGHTLVLPKRPSRNLLDAKPETLGAMMTVVQKVALAVKTVFEADGVIIKQYNEAAAGQTVFHLHVHVIPLKEGQTLKPHSGETADHAMLARHAEALRKAMG